MTSDPFVLLAVGMTIVLGGILVLRLHAFLALILGALVVGALTPESTLVAWSMGAGESEAAARRLAESSVGDRVGRAFGATCASLGILIAMASIIGVCLLASGGAERIIRAFLRLFGVRNASLGFLSSSFVLAIPVFFDTVFYLLIPLAKAMAAKAGRHYVLLVLSIAAGGTMTHSLVPPTPGPLFVATQMGIDLGTMIICGIVVGLFTTLAGYGYAVWSDGRRPIPVRSTPDVTREELHELSRREDRELPPLWLALLPITLPVVLIAGATTVSTLLQGQTAPAWPLVWADEIFSRLGNRNIALTLAAGVALATLMGMRRHDRTGLADLMQKALSSAGLIILITAGGGAFGATLQQTGIGLRIGELTGDLQMAILPLAFAVTALVRTAQGSATVAMITAIGIVGGMVNSDLAFHPVYVALAIGCGSKPFPWMNDSGFWIVCKMSGMTEAETIRNFSFMLSIMGVVGLLVVMLGASLFPLV